MDLLNELKSLAVKTISDCTHVKDISTHGEKRVLLPSGDEKYYAFWVRDCAMMAESHLVSDDDLRFYIFLTATYGQNGAETLYLKNGLEVPPYAVTDHINYNTKPVFFPGDYKDGDDQGDGIWGSYPPFCDNYYFITMVYDYITQSGDRDILDKVFAGMPLCERLAKALEGYEIDEKTGFPVSNLERHTVNWGFTDSITFGGRLLFASLLRYNAARCMNEIFPGMGYGDLAEKIKNNIVPTFYDEKTGWLFATDEGLLQHDVWGTAYALYLGILDEERTIRTSKTLADAYKNGTTGVHGYIRHVPEGEDAVPGKTMWEHACIPIEVYQNGCYWATPLGWYAYAVSKTDMPLATDMLTDFVKYTKERAGEGAPFEFFRRDGSNPSGMLYGTSGVLPYLGALRIL